MVTDVLRHGEKDILYKINLLFNRCMRRFDSLADIIMERKNYLLINAHILYAGYSFCSLIYAVLGNFIIISRRLILFLWFIPEYVILLYGLSGEDMAFQYVKGIDIGVNPCTWHDDCAHIKNKIQTFTYESDRFCSHPLFTSR